MALVKCHECGRDVSTEAAACPNCGAKPRPHTIGQLLRPEHKVGLGLLIGIAAFFWLAHQSSEPSSTQDEIPVPSAEVSLIAIASTAQSEARSTKNEMKQDGIKARRDKALCDAMPQLSVRDWIGTVEKLESSNLEGKGIVSIEVAPGILVKTWNNAFSDIINGDTLLDVKGPVYQAAAKMEKGQRVVFSGTFIKERRTKCPLEASLTVAGSLRKPEYIFQFAQLVPYEEAQRARRSQRPADANH